MKIAIGAYGPGEQAMIDPRFGRCAYFVFVDTDSGAVDSQPNDGLASAHGAGVQAAQVVIQSGADAVIAARVGPNAFQVLRSAGVRVYQAQSMSVEEAVAALKANRLVEVGQPSGPGHFGGGGRRR
ncbi:MAG: NifB/NifX family molybdenum-iron cluster-binding protein [Anaerolineae bacterium]